VDAVVVVAAVAAVVVVADAAAVVVVVDAPIKSRPSHRCFVAS